MGPLQKHHPQNGCFVICLQCPLLHSAWPSCSLQPFYTIGNLQFKELIVHATHYFQIPMKIAQNTTLFCRKRVSCHVFPTFCASNRAPDGSFRVQLFVPQIVLQMGLFRVQLFVLQIVLQIGLFARNFLCSKSCSRWVFSRATFCVPNRAPDGSFRVQLFVLQIVLQMGLFACNFLGVQELEKITWFHFACCSRFVIVCTFFFAGRVIFGRWLNKQNKVLHLLHFYLIFVKFVLHFFVV